MTEKDNVEKEVSHEIKSVEKSLKKNPWMIASIVLGVAVIVLLFVAFSGGTTGKVISSNDAGSKTVNFINTQLLQGQGTVTLASVTEDAGLYLVTVNYNGKQVPTYITKDGKYFVQGVAPMDVNSTASASNTPTAPANITKSDKPTVEAFVFAYCPYGLQFEKALIPVYNTLKNDADIKLTYIGDMHDNPSAGDYHEQNESYRQICIQKNYGTDKLFAYLEKFDTNSSIGSCNGNDACLNPLIGNIYTQLSINANTITTCMQTDAPAIYQADEARASQLGVGGSPTFMINGVDASSSVGARSPSAILKAICSAFNNVPAGCSQTLSTTSESAGFGAAAGSSTGAQC